MPSKQIVVRINELLRQKGRTLYWLAKEADLNTNTVYNLANNKTEGITWDVLGSICKVLDCQPGDILYLANGECEGERDKSAVG